MQTVTGADAFLLWEEHPGIHMHTLKLVIIDPKTADHPLDFEQFKRLAIERLPLFSAFRLRVVKSPLPFLAPIWIEQGRFDVKYHLHHVILPKQGGEHQLNQLMSDVVSTQLRRDKPLWQIYFIEGLEDGRIAYLLKIHHAVADGNAMASLALNVFQGINEKAPTLPPKNKLQPLLEVEKLPARKDQIKLSLYRTLLAYLQLPYLCIHSLKAILANLKRKRMGEPQTIAAFSCQSTRFNQRPTSNRIVSHVSLSLSDMKKVKKSFGCTVNDVLLSVVGGALHCYLSERNELPPQPITAVIPVSIRMPGDDPTSGNSVSQWFASTGSHIADPKERIQFVIDSTRAARSHFAMQKPTLSKEWFNLWLLRKLYIVRLPQLITALSHRPSYNIIVSNVPGPSTPLYSDGGKLESIRSIGPLARQQGLNITAWSYVDQFSICMQACNEHAPDLDQLADAFMPELDALLTLAKG